MIDDSELVNSLLRQGLIDQTTLKEGIERTRRSGRPLYETLIFARLVGERELVGLVGRLLKVASVDVVAQDIPLGIRQLIPGSLARRNRVIPLEVSDNELVLGMFDPLDVLAMDEVATHTGIDIRPVLVGPATLQDAIDLMYGAERDALPTTDDVMGSFDLDVDGIMDDVMAGDAWSDFFDDGPPVEDSAILARDMRDRPSTDVLAEEDVDAAVAEADAVSDVVDDEDEADLFEIEIIEELGKPKPLPAPYALLDDWEVDDAITSSRPGKPLILTAEGAEEFFRTERREADTSVFTRDDDDVATGVADATGRTELGVGPALAADAADAIKPRASRESRRKSSEHTDYGALGRSILEAPSAEELVEDSIDGIGEVTSNPSSGGPIAPGTDPLIETPYLVEDEPFATALAELLVSKGLLTADEVAALKHSVRSALLTSED